MKAVLSCTLLVSALSLARADIVARWNFNSPTPDADTATGTTLPSEGNGSAALLSGLTASFAAGCTNDPAADNSGWNTASYPAQGASNKLAGVQFNLSTLGYSAITISWDQRVSSSASKYYRLQYSADGLTFFDYPQPIIMQAVSTRPSYYESQTNSLDWLPELDNCPAVAFRIVSEFQSTAVGGPDNYVTTFGTNAYSRAGTVRFDMLTVFGAPIPGANTPPRILGPTNQTLRVNQTAGPLPVRVWDAEDPPQNLTLTASSSDQAVLPDANIWWGGTGTNRTVTLHAGTQPGTAVVTLCVTDTGTRSNTASFVVSVLPMNTPPFISTLPRTNTLTGVPTPPLPFTVGDLETPAATLSVSAFSLNTNLVPNDEAHLVLGGAGSNRTLTLLPVPGQSGVAPIRLAVSDGQAATQSVFPLLVLPNDSLIFYDPFEYPDGSLLTNSAFLWDHRSGTNGQCSVVNGQLQITTSQTEDVVAPLVGGPYTRSNNTVLYAGFKVRFLTSPRTAPGLFAHFAEGSVLRGRIYAATTNSWAGGFRLFVANGSDTNTMLPVILSTNATYNLVTRYDLDQALTTLWVNPTAETDPGTTATDTQSASSITAYGFRQDTDLGATLFIDDLKVGFEFSAVLPSSTRPSPIPLTIQQAGSYAVLRWTNSSFHLQAAPTPAGPFTNIESASSPFNALLTGHMRCFRLAIPGSAAFAPQQPPSGFLNR